MSIHKIVYIFLLSFLTVYGQQSFEDFKRQQKNDFDDFKKSVNDEYADFKSKEEIAFNTFKNKVEREWKDFKSSTPTMYVSYDDDLKSRGAIDYDSGDVIIEVIIEEEDFRGGFIEEKNRMDPDKFVNQEYSNFGRNMSLLNSFLLPLNPQTADHIDRELSQNKGEPLLQNLADTKLFKKLLKFLDQKDDSGESLFKGQIKDSNGLLIKSNSNIKSFAEGQVQNTTKEITNYIGKDGKKRAAYLLKFSLHPDHKKIRSNKYGKKILKQSKRFNIDPAIAMAVTETESSFNPKATSHIPAYGLMQLVPSSGGRDAYKYVYGEDKFLGKRYLYKPNNNIELGCAYLGKIRHQYFKGIKDDEKALICTVAAYNTGVGNVARALTNSTKLSPTIKKVNSMSSATLYKTLLKDLKHAETRNYLKKVWERKEKYNL